MEILETTCKTAQIAKEAEAGEENIPTEQEVKVFGELYERLEWMHQLLWKLAPPELEIHWGIRSKVNAIPL